jgi:hypothetical protein
MTVMSLTQASHRLNSDPKTVRRWLAQAQLPLQAHPTDARLKGVSEEHVLLLARTHHRRLAELPQEPSSPPTPGAPCPLPAALLALPETLSAFEAQITALQQEVAQLTHLLLLQAPARAVPLARAAKRPAQPAPAAARSRRTSVPAPPTRQPAQVLPLIESSREGHYVVICPKQGLLPFEPDTPAWFAWLATQTSFRFVGKEGRLTAHREVERVPNAAWRAHRRMRNHTYNLHLGATEALTIAALEQAAATLQAHLS